MALSPMPSHSCTGTAASLARSLDRFCIEALEDALSQGRPEIFNTDQGSQFTDDDFTGVLRAHGVAISMDGRGRFADNIFVERLWRSLKYEEVYLKAYESVAEARHGIAAYFEFYNHQRLHQALGYRAPRQVFVQALDLSSSARGKRWRAPNIISTMRCKLGQDFLPYDRPIAVSKIGSTSVGVVISDLAATMIPSRVAQVGWNRAVVAPPEAKWKL